MERPVSRYAALETVDIRLVLGAVALLFGAVTLGGGFIVSASENSILETERQNMARQIRGKLDGSIPLGESERIISESTILIETDELDYPGKFYPLSNRPTERLKKLFSGATIKDGVLIYMRRADSDFTGLENPYLGHECGSLSKTGICYIPFDSVKPMNFSPTSIPFPGVKP